MAQAPKSAPSSPVKSAGSLDEFVKANPAHHGGAGCWTCGLPEAEDLNKARRDRAANVMQMVGWLKSRGHDDATRSKLDYHFANGHHKLEPVDGD